VHEILKTAIQVWIQDISLWNIFFRIRISNTHQVQSTNMIQITLKKLCYLHKLIIVYIYFDERSKILQIIILFTSFRFLYDHCNIQNMSVSFQAHIHIMWVHSAWWLVFSYSVLCSCTIKRTQKAKVNNSTCPVHCKTISDTASPG
jgi:hypothetical protein